MDNIRIRTPKKNYGRGTFIIYNNPSENFETYAGLLNPPPRAMSLSSSVFNNQYRQQNQQKPPLLPLPNVSAIIQQPQLSRSISSSQGHCSRKTRTRDISLTPKKSTTTKREEGKKRITATQSSISEFLIVASDNRWGPDPKDLPKNLTVLSPPPSSLPLPKFFLRSKVSCNAEATTAGGGGGVDAGATNNLRQLLRLQ